MAGDAKDTEKLRKLVDLLAGENCGQCGFQNCGRFAVALVERVASPADCRKSIGNLDEICQLLGVEVPKAVSWSREHRSRTHAHARDNHDHHLGHVRGKGHRDAGWSGVLLSIRGHSKRSHKTHRHR